MSCIRGHRHDIEKEIDGLFKSGAFFRKSGDAAYACYPYVGQIFYTVFKPVTVKYTIGIRESDYVTPAMHKTFVSAGCCGLPFITNNFGAVTPGYFAGIIA